MCVGLKPQVFEMFSEEGCLRLVGCLLWKWNDHDVTHHATTAKDMSVMRSKKLKMPWLRNAKSRCLRTPGLQIDGWAEQAGKLRIRTKHSEHLQLYALSTVLIWISHRRTPDSGITPDLHSQDGTCSLPLANDKAISRALPSTISR